MGESTVRRGFLDFCNNFVENYYDKYIYRPTGEKLAKMMKIYSRMGLPGCIGSTDCVHLKWYRCPVGLTNLCKGKEGFPSLSYSCTVDHHRRILGVTRSNYGTRNDKTIVRLDTYITDVHYKRVNQDVERQILLPQQSNSIREFSPNNFFSLHFCNKSMKTAQGTRNLLLKSLPSRDVIEGPPGITDSFFSSRPQAWDK